MSGREKGSRRGGLGGCWVFLTRDMEYRVIPDVMNDVFLCQGTNPENFMSIGQSVYKLYKIRYHDLEFTFMSMLYHNEMSPILSFESN